MLSSVILPDGRELSVSDIREGNLAANLPAPISFLRRIAQSEREWTGVPSVTMLLNGTREVYLKIREPFSLTIDGAMYALMGTGTHALLEEAAGHEAEAEITLNIGWLTGVADLIEYQPSGELWMVDFKFQGSYSIRRYLGLVKEDVPILDEAGNTVLLKSGKNAGKPKTRGVWTVDASKADTWDKAMQQNMYRIMLKEARGVVVDKMKLFFMARDGGRNASMNGLDKLTYYPDVPFMPDDEVQKYFADKAYSLTKHLETKTMPEPCNSDEAWGGRKCRSYCPVAKYCVMHGDNPYISVEEIESADTVSDF